MSETVRGGLLWGLSETHGSRRTPIVISLLHEFEIAAAITITSTSTSTITNEGVAWTHSCSCTSFAAFRHVAGGSPCPFPGSPLTVAVSVPPRLVKFYRL